MEAVRAAFRPEFLNRLDEILLFRRLSRDDMKGIVEIQLRRLQKLLADRKITLDIDEAAKAWLADKGYDPVYGARPLKRVIQRELQNPLAQQILEGRIPDGADRACRRQPAGADDRRGRTGDGGAITAASLPGTAGILPASAGLRARAFCSMR